MLDSGFDASCSFSLGLLVRPAFILAQILPLSNPAKKKRNSIFNNPSTSTFSTPLPAPAATHPSLDKAGKL